MKAPTLSTEGRVLESLVPSLHPQRPPSEVLTDSQLKPSFVPALWGRQVF
jgi:hypothetical protein